MVKVKRKYMKHSRDKKAKQNKNKCDCYIDSSEIMIERVLARPWFTQNGIVNVVELNRTLSHGVFML